MEITEFTVQEQIDLVKQELRGFEMQYVGRMADESKFQDLLSAHSAGEFKDWDRAVVASRAREWTQQRDAARIDAKSCEISIANVRKRLQALEEAAAERLPAE